MIIFACRMDWIQKIKILPIGYSELRYAGKRYSVTRRNFNAGKSIKIYAKELGGNDFISFNFYAGARSNYLKPCEMPEEEILHFLNNYELIE